MKHKKFFKYKILILLSLIISTLVFLSACSNGVNKTVNEETTLSDEIENDIDQGTLEDSIKVDDSISISSPIIQDNQKSLFFQYQNTGDHPVEISSFSIFNKDDNKSSFKDVTGSIIYAPAYLDPGDNGYAFISGIDDLKSNDEIEIVANYKNEISSTPNISISASGVKPVTFFIENHEDQSFTINGVAGLFDRQNTFIGIAYIEHVVIEGDSTKTIETDHVILEQGKTIDDVITFASYLTTLD